MKKPAALSLPTIDEIDKALAERSLEDFVRQAWHIIEPATEILWGWHMSAVCQHLEAVTRGEIRNLIINIPPGHAKSTLVSVMWPCWEWTTKPSVRWLFASYAASLSIRDSVKCRRIITSQWYQQRWGTGTRIIGGPDETTYELTSDQNAKVKFENDATGYRIATSVGGAATGERANRVVVDDPLNASDRDSDVKRASANDWWDNVFSNRVADYKRDSRVIIMQRLHERDLTGHLIEQGGYEHLNLPTEFESDRRSVTSIGWKDPREAEGELLFPARFGPTEVEEAKRTLGATGYAGQHQQRPAPAGGGLFKEDWIRVWTFDETRTNYRLLMPDGWKTIPVKSCSRFAVMDVAGSAVRIGTDPDYTVVQVWDKAPSNELILVDQWRAQCETPESADGAVTLIRKWDCPILIVESNGVGLGVFQAIQRRGIAVKGERADRDKVTRSQASRILMEAGKFFFNRDADYLPALKAELVTFPTGAHDDQVDGVSMAGIHGQSALDLNFFSGGPAATVHAA